MKANQRGRSMIEMLGVLAIIGVLSVGGIAGYSKAMQKHKINQTINQVSMVVGGIQRLFATQGTRYAGADSIPLLVKANIIDVDMIEGDVNGTTSGSLADEVDWEVLFDSWSESWREDSKESYLNGDASQFCHFYSSGKNYGNYQDCLDNREEALRNAAELANAHKLASYIRTPIDATMTITAGNKVFAVNLLGVSQEACIDLASKDWGAGTDNFLGLSVGDQSVTSGVMSVADAVAGCSGDSNNMSFMFK